MSGVDTREQKEFLQNKEDEVISHCLITSSPTWILTL